MTTIALSGVLAGVLAVPLTEAFKTRARLGIRNELVFAARTALDRMARDLRMIALSGVNPDISAAEGSRIDFGSNVYRLSGTDLQYSSNGGGTYRTLASGVASLAFDYRNETGVALASLPLNGSDRHAIRRISITLALSKAASAAATESITVATSVYLRAFVF